MAHAFTSESVTEGHPDKVADQISDAILDDLLSQDEESRVACETLLANGLCVVAGEITTKGYADVVEIARRKMVGIGYDSAEKGFDASNYGVAALIGEQSQDIAGGVSKSLEAREGTAKDDDDKQGAGDQGMMFGFACDETDTYMPMPIHLAHRLAEQLTEVRRADQIPYLCPDGKTQVTVLYDGNEPIGLNNVVVSTQHQEHIGSGKELDQIMRPEIIKHVIEPIVGKAFPGIEPVSSSPKDESQYEAFINPSGRFVSGGPEADAGLTGRKIIVDTYGGYARHGGGAFSGKDPSKVDRSGAYAARWVAKHLVAAGAVERCEVRVAYAIGKAKPVSVDIESFDTARVDDQKLDLFLSSGECFDLRPARIKKDLNLLKPIYAKTAAYGHFGREPEGDYFPWEKLDPKRLDFIKSTLGL